MTMGANDILDYLSKQIDLLQRKVVELQEQHDDVERQLRAYKQLVRMYRGVYESEAGVGLQNRIPAQIIEILEKKLTDEGISAKQSVKKKAKHRRETK